MDGESCYDEGDELARMKWGKSEVDWLAQGWRSESESWLIRWCISEYAICDLQTGTAWRSSYRITTEERLLPSGDWREIISLTADSTKSNRNTDDSNGIFSAESRIFGGRLAELVDSLVAGEYMPIIAIATITIHRCCRAVDRSVLSRI